MLHLFCINQIGHCRSMLKLIFERLIHPSLEKCANFLKKKCNFLSRTHMNHSLKKVSTHGAQYLKDNILEDEIQQIFFVQLFAHYLLGLLSLYGLTTKTVFTSLYGGTLVLSCSHFFMLQMTSQPFCSEKKIATFFLQSKRSPSQWSVAELLAHPLSVPEIMVQIPTGSLSRIQIKK